MPFEDRQDAGRRLAALLEKYRREDPIVLALPRGGVPVAYEVAAALEAPLDVLVARKLPAPGYPEYGIGAMAEGGAVYVSAQATRELGIGPAELERIAEREGAELLRRVKRYRGDRPLPDLAGKTVLLVDDGIATGGTARAAARAVRERRAGRVVLAAPVVAASSLAEVAAEVDDLVYVEAPEHFYSVGQWYQRFGQTSDEEVVEILERAARERLALAEPGTPRDPWAAEWIEPAGHDPPAGAEEREVEIPLDRLRVGATLAVPAGARGMVLFAHGSGSSRFSPRNRFVAAALRRAGLGTLLLDLLTDEEDGHEALRFDVELLARRLLAATRWLRGRPETAGMGFAYFGASTGAAAALAAAAEAPEGIFAVVSRGGRPDLVDPRLLGLVQAPTLLVVGGADETVLMLNRDALGHLHCAKRLEVVPGATHLFEEPGALEGVARRAVEWLTGHLPVTTGAAAHQ